MNSLSRRDFLRLGGLAAATLGAAACAPAPAPTPEAKKEEAAAPTAPPATMAEEVTINVWWWLSEPYQTAVPQFTKTHPNIKVNLSEIGDAVFGDQKYLTAVAAGTGPDASIQNRHTWMQFAARGLYKAVDEYFKRDNYKVADFTPVQLQESQWQGVLYGMPVMTDTRHLFYNKKHFAEAGLSEPPQTWDQVDAYTAKLTKKDAAGNFQVMGFVPYLVGNSWMWMYGFLNKAPAISSDKRTILCDDERWVYALDWMKSIYDKYLGSFEITSAFSQSFETSAQDLFIQQKLAMVVTGDWELNRYSRFPDLDWDMVAMAIPPQGEKSSWSCCWGLVIAPEAKHPDEAWEYLKWQTGVDGWKAIAESDKAQTKKQWEREQIPGEPLYVPPEACYLPAVDMLEKEYVAALPDKQRKAYELGIDCLKNWTHGCGTEMGLAALTYWVEIDNAVRTALAGKMTSAEALKAAKEKVQKATDEAWAAIEKKG